MPKKYSIDFIRSELSKEGFLLLSIEYINAENKLIFLCPFGHKYNSSWHTWQHGSRCPYCSGVAKKNIDEVRKSFETEGYTLLSKTYINCKNKLHYICGKGHSNFITWTNWQQGKRCPKCSVNAIKDYVYIKNLFESEGCILLDSAYINNKQKINYICANGHKHAIKLNDWLDGHRCSYCYGNANLDIDFIKNEFSKEDYILKNSKYTNAYSTLYYTCDYGHNGSTTWHNWRNGSRCPICYRVSMYGPKNPAWKGGISYEPYCPIWKDTEFKEDIKARDGFKCLNPACNSKNSNDLTIHHIDYNKKNCSPSNLITVCRSCNSKANSDRKWHKAWYATILNKRYKY